MEKYDDTDLKVKATHNLLLSNDAHQAFFLSASKSVKLRKGKFMGGLEWDLWIPFKVN